MAGYQRCISLALVCLLLRHDDMAAGLQSPVCNTIIDSSTQHDNFLKRHFVNSASFKGSPNNNDIDKWKEYFEKSKDIRETRSFLMNSDMDQVMGVCKDSGGRYFTGISGKTDLCISNDKFKFLTVYPNTKTVILEDKHLILACGKVGNDCKPIHFEWNESSQPMENDIGCRNGKPKSAQKEKKKKLTAAQKNEKNTFEYP